MSGPQFNLDHAVTYGALDQVSPLVQRVTANNPGKFTFRGTGTYIIGTDRVAIVDPGPANDAHVDALVQAVAGRTVTHLLITHTHSDHSPAARLLQTHIDAPTVGFGPHPVPRPNAAPIEDRAESSSAESGTGDRAESSTEDSADWDYEPDIVAGHGTTVEGDGWTVDALHTPGHISNHLCFALRQERGLFSGDHVMGWSTTVIPAPDGDLNAYLASLELLLPRDDLTYWPTHGAPIDQPQKLVTELIAHRRNRTSQVLACLSQGLDSIDDIVAVMYADKPKELHKPAAKSVLAHLRALVAEGRVASSDPDPAEASTFTSVR